jgi:hypothetical protein
MNSPAMTTSVRLKQFDDACSSFTMDINNRAQDVLGVEQAQVLRHAKRDISYEIVNPSIDDSAPKDGLVALNSYAGKVREIIKQRWTGVVTEHFGNSFAVIIKDETNKNNPDEIVELSVDEIEPHDRSLIKPGAMLNWYIGYRQGNLLPRERFSVIRFRRLPKWTQQELDRANERAKEYAQYFAVD